MTTTQRLGHFDLAVVGAGILGLATALAGARRGLRVVVIDRDAHANGASVRNFGFVTVTGQQRGTMWQRARRSREVWQEVAAAAGIPILQSGVWMAARRAESVRVLEAFMATEMAAGCRLLDPAEARRHCPQLARAGPGRGAGEQHRTAGRVARCHSAAGGVAGGSRTASPSCAKPACAPSRCRSVHTSRGALQAEHVASVPGDDFNSLYPERFGAYRADALQAADAAAVPPRVSICRPRSCPTWAWRATAASPSCRPPLRSSAATARRTAGPSRAWRAPHRGAERRWQPGGR